MPQTGYGQPYASQPLMGYTYPRINIVWNPFLNQQYLQPTLQIPYNQPAQSAGQFGFTQV